MDDRPRNLRTMLAEAKDLSELMVDLGYAALFFNDPDMAEEVTELEEQMTDLVQDMRWVCIMAARKPRDAEGMSSVLQVISAIERIANTAVDIARIVTHKLGIPAQLVADLAEAEEISHRVLVSEGSHMTNMALRSLELPVATGMRVMAVKRGREWLTDVDGDLILGTGDVLFLRGSPDGIIPLRQLAGAPVWHPPVSPEDPWLSDLDRAVDVLVEMKNLSEAAVGLAYSALVIGDRRLAAEVRHLEHRLDEMNDRLELWVLRASKADLDPSPLRGLLQLAHAAEDMGDQAHQMVRLIEDGEEIHPILEIALGDSDEVIAEMPVAASSDAASATLGELRLNIEPGFTVLAIRRHDRYVYRPRGHVQLEADDELVVSGPEEGLASLAAVLGWRLLVDDESGEAELVPVGS
jgi:uncharacterized protein with PhoU and TrkA domain